MVQITPDELYARMSSDSAPLLLDVREPHEVQICRIEGSRNIPMHEIPRDVGTLDRDAEIVVICHHGVRSQSVAEYLERSGFSRVANLAGGIDAWSTKVDPGMPRY